MPDATPVERQLIELQRTGQLSAVLAIVRDDYQKARKDLDVLLLTKLCTDEATRGEILALQGMIKGLAGLYNRLVTLGHASQPPIDGTG